MEIKGIIIHRFEEGKIVEEWEAYDNLSVLQQLGLVPEQYQGKGKLFATGPGNPGSEMGYLGLFVRPQVKDDTFVILLANAD